MPLNERVDASQPEAGEPQSLWAEAMNWLLRLQAGEPSKKVWAEFETWIASDPRRRQTYYRVEREWPARRERLKSALMPQQAASVFPSLPAATVPEVRREAGRPVQPWRQSNRAADLIGARRTVHSTTDTPRIEAKGAELPAPVIPRGMTRRVSLEQTVLDVVSEGTDRSAWPAQVKQHAESAYGRLVLPQRSLLNPLLLTHFAALYSDSKTVMSVVLRELLQHCLDAVRQPAHSAGLDPFASRANDSISLLAPLRRMYLYRPWLPSAGWSAWYQSCVHDRILSEIQAVRMARLLKSWKYVSGSPKNSTWTPVQSRVKTRHGCLHFSQHGSVTLEPSPRSEATRENSWRRISHPSSIALLRDWYRWEMSAISVSPNTPARSAVPAVDVRDGIGLLGVSHASYAPQFKISKPFSDEFVQTLRHCRVVYFVGYSFSKILGLPTASEMLRTGATQLPNYGSVSTLLDLIESKANLQSSSNEVSAWAYPTPAEPQDKMYYLTCCASSSSYSSAPALPHENHPATQDSDTPWSFGDEGNLKTNAWAALDLWRTTR